MQDESFEEEHYQNIRTIDHNNHVSRPKDFIYNEELFVKKSR